MKITMKIAFVALLLVAGLFSAQAQQKNFRKEDPAKRAEMQTNRMRDSLGLDAKQVEKVGSGSKGLI